MLGQGGEKLSCCVSAQAQRRDYGAAVIIGALADDFGGARFELETRHHADAGSRQRQGACPDAGEAQAGRAGSFSILLWSCQKRTVRWAVSIDSFR